jgi:spermidine synthase
MKKTKYICEKGLPFDEVGAKICFPLIKKIYFKKSKYQKIEIFDLKFWGKALYLDGVLQTTKRDEFIYHETIAHSALFSHNKPEKVLIIGGGDGGTVKEVIKHKQVKEIILCELDGEVIKASQKYLSEISKKAWQDKRLKIIIKDGKELIKNYLNYFDVIILDLPDPSENAKSLISNSFYRAVKNALAKNGIISVQSESLTNQIGLASLINRNLKKVFKFVRLQRVCIPSYQAGEFSLTLASDFNLDSIKIESLRKKSKGFDLKYYSPEIHFSSKILPLYLKQKIGE